MEILCTAFQGGPFGPALNGVDRNTGKPSPMPLGHIFIAIDIEVSEACAGSLGHDYALEVVMSLTLSFVCSATW